MNTKAASERYQRQVLELVKQPGNDMCADCCGRAPRWASWNLGIFVCVQCAGIHRKMGTHISKIKSLTLDTWTRDHIERMREMGNIKSNEMWNPDERRNRPPANIDEGERNSELEKFIFDKYKGKFMEKKPPPVPQKDASSSSLRLSPSPNPVRSYGAADGEARRRLPESLRDSDPITRSKTAPIPASWAEARARAASASPALSAPKLPDRETSTAASSRFAASASASATSAAVVAVPPPSSHNFQAAFVRSTGRPQALPSLQVPTLSSANHSQGSNPASSSSVFDDLLQLQHGSAPIPYPSFQTNPWAGFQATNQSVQSPGHIQTSQQSRQPQVSFSPQSAQSGSQNAFANSTHCHFPFSGPAFSLDQHHYPGHGNSSMVASVSAMQHHVANASPGAMAFTSQEASVNPMQNNPFSQHQQPIFRSAPPQNTGQGGGMQPPMTAFGNLQQQQQQQQQQQERMMMGQQAFSPGFHTYSPQQQQGNSQNWSYFG